MKTFKKIFYAFAFASVFAGVFGMFEVGLQTGGPATGGSGGEGPKLLKLLKSDFRSYSSSEAPSLSRGESRSSHFGELTVSSLRGSPELVEGRRNNLFTTGLLPATLRSRLRLLIARNDITLRIGIRKAEAAKRIM